MRRVTMVFPKCIAVFLNCHSDMVVFPEPFGGCVVGTKTVTHLSKGMWSVLREQPQRLKRVSCLTAASALPGEASSHHGAEFSGVYSIMYAFHVHWVFGSTWVTFTGAVDC